MNLVKEGNKNWSELTTKCFSLRMHCDLLLNAEIPGLFLLVIILRMEVQEFSLRNNCQLCWEYFSAGACREKITTIENAERDTSFANDLKYGKYAFEYFLIIQISRHHICNLIRKQDI